MNDSQARDIALVVGLTGMSTVIVMLRIIARMKGKATFGADDYWIFAAAALNLPYMGVYIWGAIQEQGNHDLGQLPLASLIEYLKSVYIDAVLYCIIITFAKYSVLCLYHRIFGKAIRRGIIAVAMIQTIWMVVCVCEGLFRCSPVQGAWDVTISAVCQNFQLIVIAAEPFNCFLDFVMVALPIRVVRSLQLPVRHKIAVSAIFLLGSFVGIMTILRIIETANGNVNTSNVWVLAQMNTGIVCACLPTLRAMLPRNDAILNGLRTVASLLGRTSTSRAPGHGASGPDSKSRSKNSRYRNLDNDNMADSAYLTITSRGSDILETDRNFPLDRIVVQHDVSIA